MLASVGGEDTDRKRRNKIGKSGPQQEVDLLRMSGFPEANPLLMANLGRGAESVARNQNINVNHRGIGRLVKQQREARRTGSAVQGGKHHNE